MFPAYLRRALLAYGAILTAVLLLCGCVGHGAVDTPTGQSFTPPVPPPAISESTTNPWDAASAALAAPSAIGDALTAIAVETAAPSPSPSVSPEATP
jgi:hypothetical protein